MKLIQHTLKLSAVLVLLFSNNVIANASDETKAEAAQKPQACQVINVEVNGLVCDFCARALEKVFGKQDAVDTIAVDLDAALVRIELKEGKTLADERIRAFILDSGYNTVGIDRSCSG